MDHAWCMIPDNVLRDNRLTSGAKILYGKVLGTASRRGFCVLNNSQLSEEVGFEEESVRKYIRELSEYEYIEIDDEGRRRLIPYMYGDGEGDAPIERSPYTDATQKHQFTVTELFKYWTVELELASEYWGVPYRSREETPARLRKIANRLEDGYTKDDIKAAVKGCVWNEFNIKGGYTDITLICRSPEKVEQYMAKHDRLEAEKAKPQRREFAEFSG